MAQVIDQPLIECTESQSRFLRLWLKVLGARGQVARAEQIMRKQFVLGISILKML
ncbi:hypothetical protein D3C76_1672360 [compost metagenome]